MCNTRTEYYLRYRKHWSPHLRRALIVRDAHIKGPYRCIFDIYSDPRTRRLAPDEKAKLAIMKNAEKAKHIPTVKHVNITPEDILRIEEQIKSNINLSRASSVVYADWTEHLTFPDHLEEMIENIQTMEPGASRISAIRNLHSLILQRNDDYAKDFLARVEGLEKQVKEQKRLEAKEEKKEEKYEPPTVLPDPDFN